jgi:hypothetical protein
MCLKEEVFYEKEQAMLLDGSGLCLDWFHSNIDVAGGGRRQPISSCNE